MCKRMLSHALPGGSYFFRLYHPAAALSRARPPSGTRVLLCACDAVAVLREAFAPDVFMARNRYMVDRSERVIAVYDGRAWGGTAATIRMAREQDRKLRMIRPAGLQVRS